MRTLQPRLWLSLLSQAPYQDSTARVAFAPVNVIARLVALMPQARVNLTRYHGLHLAIRVAAGKMAIRTTTLSSLDPIHLTIFVTNGLITKSQWPT